MAKTKAFGTKFVIKGTGDSTYTLIGYVKDITGPGESVETVDVTTHDSAGSAREYLSTLREGGEVSFEIEYDLAGTDTGQVALQAAFVGMTLQNCGIVMPTGTMNGYASGTQDKGCVKFDGFITKREPAFEVAGSIRQSFTVKVTGAVSQYSKA